MVMNVEYEGGKRKSVCNKKGNRNGSPRQSVRVGECVRVCVKGKDRHEDAHVYSRIR